MMAHSSWQHHSKPAHSGSAAECMSLPVNSDIIAFMRVNLHAGGEVSVDASDNAQSCIGMSNTLRLGQQLRRANQTYLLKKNDNAVVVPPKKQARGSRRRQRSISSEISNQDEESVATEQHTGNRQQRNAEFRRQTLTLNARSDDKHSSTTTLNDPPCQVACETFVISDEEKLRQYYLHLFHGLQQAAVKRIAKLWIKGICPRKQATFPYQSSETVPQWWPSADLCPFTEPDHIKKDERLELCLHLLRLRPDPDVLKEWNGNTIEAHPSHVQEGWTAFLEQIAPPSALLDARENGEATAKRAEYLKKLYEVARIEESFHDGGVDATHQIQWPKEEIQPQIPRRRPHRAVEDDAVAIKSIKKRKRRSSKAIVASSRSPANRKKSRKDSSKDIDASINHTVETSQFVEGDTIADEDTSYQDQELGYRYTNSMNAGCDSFLSRHDSTQSGSHPTLTWMHGASGIPSHGNDSCTTSFASSASSFYPTSTATSFMVDNIHDPMHNAVDGQSSLHDPRLLHDEDTHMHPAYCATVPNSPILSTAALTTSKLKQENDLGIGLSQHPWLISSNTPASSSTLYNNFYPSTNHDSPMVFSPNYIPQPGLQPSHGSAMANLPIHSRFPTPQVKSESQRYFGNGFRS